MKKEQKNKAVSKKTLLSSIIVLIVCVAMLLGTTFAWFTDSVSNTGNRIQAGTLDVDLLMYKEASQSTEAGYQSIGDSTGDIFTTADVATNSNATLWEPGKTQIVFLAVENKGNLALKYNIKITTKDVDGHPSMVQNDYSALEYVIYDGMTKAAYDALNPKPEKWADITGTLGIQKGDVVLGNIIAAPNGRLLPKNEESEEDGTDYFALAVHMKEDAGNNFKDAAIEIDVNIVATQETYEKDGFDSDQYDKLPIIWTDVTATGKVSKENLNGAIIIKDSEEVLVNALIPGLSFDEPLKPGTNFSYTSDQHSTTYTPDTAEKDHVLELKVNPESITSTAATYDISLINKTENNDKIKEINKVMQIEMLVGTGLTSVTVKHNGIPMTDSPSREDQTYTYNPDTGIVTIYTKSFSPFEIKWVQGVPMAYIDTISPLPTSIDFMDLTTKFGTTKKNDVVTPAPLHTAYTFKAFETEEDATAIRNLISAMGITDDSQLGYLTPEAIEYALSFVEDEALKARLSSILYSRKDYLTWRADYTVSFDKAVAHNTVGFAGQYAAFSDMWVGFGLPADVPANIDIRLLDSAYNAFGQASVFHMTYASICGWVQTFNCGLVNYSEDNIGTTATVSLYLYELDQNGAETGTKVKVCSIPYTFDKAYTGNPE